MNNVLIEDLINLNGLDEGEARVIARLVEQGVMQVATQEDVRRGTNCDRLLTPLSIMEGVRND